MMQIPVSELQFILDILNKFEYPFEEDGKAEFSAEFDCDWFFHVKNQLERIIAESI